MGTENGRAPRQDRIAEQTLAHRDDFNDFLVPPGLRRQFGMVYRRSAGQQ
jgi:hypothetical protein